MPKKEDLRPVVHLFRNGEVEVLAASREGCPCAYRWTPGYSQVTAAGVSAPYTRRTWQAMARRDGERLLFHPDHKSARLAAQRSEFNFTEEEVIAMAQRLGLAAHQPLRLQVSGDGTPRLICRACGATWLPGRLRDGWLHLEVIATGNSSCL